MIVKIPVITIKNNNHPDILQIDMKVSCFLTGAFFFLLPIINPPKWCDCIYMMHCSASYAVFLLNFNPRIREGCDIEKGYCMSAILIHTLTRNAINNNGVVDLFIRENPATLR